MHSFNYAYGLVIFVHFDLHDGFGLIIEFRADVSTSMFIILILMQDSMDVYLFIIRPLHEFRYNVSGFTG